MKPRVLAYPPTLKAIKTADLIVVGPGDLYSSLAQILLTQGVAGAIRRSRAKKVFVCNLVTKNGETNGFSVRDFTTVVEKYLGGQLDYVIYNNFAPPSPRIKKYLNGHPELLSLVEAGDDLPPAKFLGANLFLKSGPLEHDPKKLAKIITSLA